MITRSRHLICFLFTIGFAPTHLLMAQDWPQWRGAHGNAKVFDFKVPAKWPEALTEVWKIDVGDGVATPSIAGNRLYVFARQDGKEIIRCMDPTNGKTVWEDSYEAKGTSGPAGGFQGPRCSPAIAEGKVVLVGVHGIVSCYDAEQGKLVWRNNDFEGDVPRFNTSSSPIILDKTCIVQLGNNDDGGIFGFNLDDGKINWSWKGGGPSYASPVVAKFGEINAIIAATEKDLVVVNANDGTELWKTEYQQGRYNATSPLVNDSSIIVAGPGRGATSYAVSTADGKLDSKENWRNDETSLQFNTPVIRDGLAFGISNQNEIFCVDTSDGKTAWSAPMKAATPSTDAAQSEPPQGERPQGGRGGRGGRGGGGGGGGYGSVVDAGETLFALSPVGTLVAFKPSKNAFEKLAEYKVADGGTYAYPVVSGEFIYIKDKDSLIKFQVK